MPAFLRAFFSCDSPLHRPETPQRPPHHTSPLKHGDVIVCATTACLRARLRTAPIRSRERQRADAQLLMTFCLALLESLIIELQGPAVLRDRADYVVRRTRGDFGFDLH